MDPADSRSMAIGASARAAESRAKECRRRLSALRASLAPSAADTALALDRLARARGRAAAAEERAAEALRNHTALGALRRMRSSGEVGRTQLPGWLEGGAAATPMAALVLDPVRGGSTAIIDLWLAFVSLDGRADLTEFEAFLYGAWTMSARDRTVLEHVLWERDSFDGWESRERS